MRVTAKTSKSITSIIKVYQLHMLSTHFSQRKKDMLLNTIYFVSVDK